MKNKGFLVVPTGSGALGLDKAMIVQIRTRIRFDMATISYCQYVTTHINSITKRRHHRRFDVVTISELEPISSSPVRCRY